MVSIYIYLAGHVSPSWGSGCGRWGEDGSHIGSVGLEDNRLDPMLVHTTVAAPADLRHKLVECGDVGDVHGADGIPRVLGGTHLCWSSLGTAGNWSVRVVTRDSDKERERDG